MYFAAIFKEMENHITENLSMAWLQRDLPAVLQRPK